LTAFDLVDLRWSADGGWLVNYQRVLAAVGPAIPAEVVVSFDE
jgi:hypothetical protein